MNENKTEAIAISAGSGVGVMFNLFNSVVASLITGLSIFFILFMMRLFLSKLRGKTWRNSLIFALSVTTDEVAKKYTEDRNE